MQPPSIKISDAGEAANVSPRIRRKKPAAINTFGPIIAAADFAVAALALTVAWWLRFETSLSKVGVPVSEAPTLGHYLGHIFLGATLLVVIPFNFHIFDPDLCLIKSATPIWKRLPEYPQHSQFARSA